MGRGRSKVAPPSKERAMKMVFWKWSPPCQNTYSPPLLSVRSQQSWRPLPVMLVAAGASYVVRGMCQLLLGPGVTTVAGPGHHDRFGEGVGPALQAAEGRHEDVDVPEERAGGGVVGPDLLVVGEQRGVLLGGDHRRQPGVGVAGRCRPRVVGAGDRDRLEPLEGLLGVGRG